MIERLKKLWGLRLAAAQTSPAAHHAELSAFSWWFTSGKFDDEWALNQLCNVLRLIGTIQHYLMVPERLAEVASNHPSLAVECLRLMIEGEKEGWHIHRWRDAPRRILQVAKQSGDAAVREAVDDVVNRLGARGLFEFRDLLSRTE